MKSLGMRIAVLSIAAIIVTPAFAQSGGADVYKAKCLMCHGADGAGTTPAGKALKAASFKDAAVISASDADLHAAVTNGKGKMPANQGKLTDAQIKAVVGYVRSLQK
jgi:mono/diheme cytochrome c family protein